MRPTPSHRPLVLSIIFGAAVALVIVLQWRQVLRLRDENASLRQELADLRAKAARQARHSRLADPPAAASETLGASRDTPESATPPTLAPPGAGGRIPPLTAAQVEAYLRTSRRSAESLLAAYRITGDAALLREAMASFPDHAGVAFEAVFFRDLAPAERQGWLETLCRAAPRNALGPYLLALEHFEAGRLNDAVRELTAAADRPDWDDFTLERIKLNEEAYRYSGYAVDEAKMGAMWGLDVPHLGRLRSLAQRTVDLAESYRQAGDAVSAQTALEMAFELGTRLDHPSRPGVPLITAMTGIAIERRALGAMTGSSTYGGQTVPDLRDTLEQRSASIRELVRHGVPGLQTGMSAADWLNYNERAIAFGEENAMRWLLHRQGGP